MQLEVCQVVQAALHGRDAADVTRLLWVPIEEIVLSWTPWAYSFLGLSQHSHGPAMHLLSCMNQWSDLGKTVKLWRLSTSLRSASSLHSSLMQRV